MKHAPGGVIGLGEATKTWFLISLQTFGGPAGQIAVMQRALVDERRWIGERRFLHALSYCMLLPGPEAQQLAIYIGWLLNGMVGGLVAGVLFVLPGVVALLALSWLYVAHGETALVTGLFVGLAPAVLAIVVQAVLRVGKRALGHRALVSLAVAAFLALVIGVPFPIVLASAALIGWVLGRIDPAIVTARSRADEHEGTPPLIPDEALHRAPRSARRNLTILVFGLVFWLAPIVVVALTFGRDSVLVEQGKFFAGTALVTFGGAYAVLAYVAQRAVETYGWLTGAEMVDGLAMAETTPGPLIMVVQFVAFLGAYRNPGTLDPWAAAVLASLLTTWVTFVPSFMFIFLGAPYVERLRGNEGLSAALTGITAAVVGVIANLAVYFTIHTLFTKTQDVRWGRIDIVAPVWSSYDVVALAIAALAGILLFGVKWSVLRTLGVCASVGIVVTFFS